MYGNYNYYQPQQNSQQRTISQVPPQIALKGRPVSSLEEVKATAVDFDGSIFFFPDLANKRIYTKQIQIDGTAQLNMYELKELPIDTANINMASYVTRDEFEQTLAQIKSLLESQSPKEEQSTQSQYNF